MGFFGERQVSQSKKSDAQIESVDGCLVMTGHWTLHNIHSIRSVFAYEAG